MSTEQKVFGRHPVTGIVAKVRPIELELFGMTEVPANERTGKPVINAKVRKGDDIVDEVPTSPAQVGNSTVDLKLSTPTEPIGAVDSTKPIERKK